MRSDKTVPPSDQPHKAQPQRAVYEAHEYAKLFPLLEETSPEQFEKLVNDIRARGLEEPITVVGSRILDGRNRLRAALKAGFRLEPCHFREYVGEDPLGYVISRNLHRRHLSPSQLAMLGADLEELIAKELRVKGAGQVVARDPSGKFATTAENVGRPVGGKARDRAAGLSGASARAIQDAKTIKRVSPELAAEVFAGQKTVHAAKGQLKTAPPKVELRTGGPEPNGKPRKDRDDLIASFLKQQEEKYIGFGWRLVWARNVGAGRYIHAVLRESGIELRSLTISASDGRAKPEILEIPYQFTAEDLITIASAAGTKPDNHLEQ